MDPATEKQIDFALAISKKVGVSLPKTATKKSYWAWINRWAKEYYKSISRDEEADPQWYTRHLTACSVCKSKDIDVWVPEGFSTIFIAECQHCGAETIPCRSIEDCVQEWNSEQDSALERISKQKPNLKNTKPRKAKRRKK